MKRNPYVFLGIGEKGQLELFVSPFSLNSVGARLERGKNFPSSIEKFANSTEGEEQDLLAIEALRDFHRYLHPKSK